MGLVDVVVPWGSLLLLFLVFGVAPGLCIRLLVLVYPRDNPRRKELVAELYTKGRVERVLFVGEQLETVLFEGVPLRLGACWKVVRRWWSAYFRWAVKHRIAVFGLTVVSDSILYLLAQFAVAGESSGLTEFMKAGAVIGSALILVVVIMHLIGIGIKMYIARLEAQMRGDR